MANTKDEDDQDIGELFLAELRMRRARLREWIDVLSREAVAETVCRMQPAVARAAPRRCRGRRHACAAR